MSYLEPAKVIRQILLSMPAVGPLLAPLKETQVVMAYQKFDIPTSGLFIVLSYVSGNAIGAVEESVQVAGGQFMDAQSVAMHDVIQIDMMAFEDTSGVSLARLMRGPVIMALNSSMAEALQEQYNCFIGDIGTDWQDASALESTQYLTRYLNRIHIHSVQSQLVPLDYYNTFPVSPAVVNA